MRTWALLPYLVASAAFLLPPATQAGELYLTGFDSPPFALGADTIRGTDGWLGLAALAGKGLSGVLSPSQHGVSGIGNAAYLGGNPARVTGVTSKAVYLRRPVNVNPLALGQEVATFSVVCGIKDSTADSAFRRDNFEFLIWNSDASPKLLAGIQFDNSRLDSLTREPLRAIYLLSWNGSQFVYTNTGYTFLADTLEVLDFRINFRTNRWTVSLGGAPLFQDLVFYSGPSARNLGSVLVQMQVTNTFPLSNDIHPGDNYLLFDDYQIRIDPVTVTLASSWTPDGAFKLDWNEEFGYHYRVQHSADGTNWFDFPTSIHTATATANHSFIDPTTPRPARRLFRVRQQAP